MKKLLLSVLCLTLSLSALFLVSGCGNVKPKPENKLSFKTLTVNGDKVYGKVSNDTESFSFIKEIETVGLTKFIVSLDIYGSQQVTTKTIPLDIGDNKAYVIETIDGEPETVYEVIVRRKPMYSVVFDTNGGTILDSRQIEEGTVITAPETTKAGYTLIEWDYDFTQPITQNTTIKATWSANTNTPYKVEYYKENLEDDKYTLCETSDLQGVSGAIASAEQKAYEHFTFDENESVPSGSIAGDGSLILKMYYKRNVYVIFNANSAYGEITNAATIKYGSFIKGLATEYLGCEFIGWFNGETLLSSAKRYEFTAECNVYAKFKAKDEMSGFNFKSSTTTCEITAPKDKTATSVVIPDCVTSIGDKAFYNCDKLTSVTIPDGVTSIGYMTFYNCSGLTSVTIPDSVTSIGDSAFSYCSRLTSITIPDSVTSIGNSAFSSCGRLASVTIGNGVTSIGNSAFYGCSGLASVTIGNGVTSIGNSAFYGCSGLTSVTIPDGVTCIGGFAFYGCSGLTSVTIPRSVTSIGDYAFSDCRGLTSITIPRNVTSIGDQAFSGCSGLTSVTIPRNVTSIGSGAFSSCSKLTNVEVANGNNKYHSQNNCVIETATRILIVGCNHSVIPSDGSVTAIGTNAFSGCSFTTITISDSITSIGDFAFSHCSGLTNVTIGNGVTSIGNSAFSSCGRLASVTIGNGVTSIGDKAFSGCSGLTSITFNGTKEQWRAIIFDLGWNNGVPASVAHCTDGDISIK